MASRKARRNPGRKKSAQSGAAVEKNRDCFRTGTYSVFILKAEAWSEHRDFARACAREATDALEEIHAIAPQQASGPQHYRARARISRAAAYAARKIGAIQAHGSPGTPFAGSILARLGIRAAPVSTSLFEGLVPGVTAILDGRFSGRTLEGLSPSELTRLLWTSTDSASLPLIEAEQERRRLQGLTLSGKKVTMQENGMSPEYS